MQRSELARQHGGQVKRSERLEMIVRHGIRSGRLICRVYEYADGTYLLGRFRLACEERPGAVDLVWFKGEL